VGGEEEVEIWIQLSQVVAVVLIRSHWGDKGAVEVGWVWEGERTWEREREREREREVGVVDKSEIRAMWCRESDDPWQELESKDPDHATFTNEAEFHAMGCVGSSAKGGDSEFLPLPPPPPLPTHSSYSSYLLFLCHHGTERWRSFCFGPWVVSSIVFFGITLLWSAVFY